MMEDKEMVDFITCGPYFNDLYERSRKGKKENKKIAKDEETDWGNKKLKEYFDYPKDTITKQWTTIKQWTTKIGENIVKQLLENNSFKVYKPEKKEGCKPDWETDEFIYEVKTRSYTVPGTAGEKILGVPYKYASIPRLYGKPLKIVLVGFQEKEGIENFEIFEPKSEERQKLIKFWKEELKIEYVKASDLLKSII